jgi:hypothetical protein
MRSRKLRIVDGLVPAVVEAPVAPAALQVGLEFDQDVTFSLQQATPEANVAIRSERELARVALSLAGDQPLTDPELALCQPWLEPDRKMLAIVRGRIAGGGDPLGDAFCALRTSAERRRAGAVYTPPAIVASMTAWAASQGEPERIVDPGAGSGRFLIAAGKQFPNAALIGVESDPLAALVLRGNLAACGFAARAQVIVGDYRAVTLPAVRGQTLFIGNPPYVRHHDVGAAWKSWFVQSAGRVGIPASKLAGLHVHFFFKTMELAKKGDAGAFITSSEWMDVNYGAALRHLLASGLGGASLHVLDAKALPFAGAATTGAISCFRVGERPAVFRVRAVPALSELNGLSAGTAVPWDIVTRAKRWSAIVKPTASPPPGYIELGELFRVSRGQVTGSNAIWIEGPHTKGLPDSVLLPTVTRARELIAAGDALSDPGKLRRVLSLPCELDELDPAFRKAAERFMSWARKQGAADGYVARHRRAWWSVPLYDPAPIVCTYMARRPPAFVRNLCQARLLNIAHGLYPRQPLDAETISGLLHYLRHNVSVASGRTYAGGLTKFEPGELERIPVPTQDLLRHAATARLD